MALCLRNSKTGEFKCPPAWLGHLWLYRRVMRLFGWNLCKFDITSKGKRFLELCEQGHSDEDALTIVTQEFPQ